VVLFFVEFAQHEEEEWCHVPVKVLVVKVQLRQVAQVLAVYGILESINLKHSYLVLFIAVDFISGWMEQRAIISVALQLILYGVETQAEFADI